MAGDRERILDGLTGEWGAVLGTRVEYQLAAHIDLNYLHTSRDRMIRPAEQRRYVAALPSAPRRFVLDCGHSVSYAAADELAAIINAMITEG